MDFSGLKKNSLENLGKIFLSVKTLAHTLAFIEFKAKNPDTVRNSIFILVTGIGIM